MEELNTSPYFTAVANGNSRMYKSIDLIALAGRAGLRLTKSFDDLGRSHTLLRFSRQGAAAETARQIRAQGPFTPRPGS